MSDPSNPTTTLPRVTPGDAATTDTTVMEPVRVVEPAPRDIDPGIPVGDKVFHAVATSGGAAMFAIMGGIFVFLAWQSVPTLQNYGLSFFTEQAWQPEANRIGIAAVLSGTLIVAGVAICIAFPLALLTALFISEYAPRRMKAWLVSLLDLMAAVPSVVYGLWGFFLLQPHIIHVSHWLSEHLGWIPIFHVDVDPDAPLWEPSRFTSSSFIAGVVVAMMVLPVACSIMREVFGQAPIGEREAALALGATRWGMIRAVVLPFGRGGIIGGTMLGLGRALGETIAVVFIISPLFEINLRILENGSITTSSLIALRYGESTGIQLSALMAAGLVLFVMTLIINTAASMVVARSRSGAATEM